MRSAPSRATRPTRRHRRRLERWQVPQVVFDLQDELRDVNFEIGKANGRPDLLGVLAERKREIETKITRALWMEMYPQTAAPTSFDPVLYELPHWHLIAEMWSEFCGWFVDQGFGENAEILQAIDERIGLVGFCHLIQRLREGDVSTAQSFCKLITDQELKTRAALAARAREEGRATDADLCHNRINVRRGQAGAPVIVIDQPGNPEYTPPLVVNRQDRRPHLLRHLGAHRRQSRGRSTRRRGSRRRAATGARGGDPPDGGDDGPQRFGRLANGRLAILLVALAALSIAPTGEASVPVTTTSAGTAPDQWDRACSTDPLPTGVRRFKAEMEFLAGRTSAPAYEAAPERTIHAVNCWPAPDNDDSVWGLASPGITFDGDVLRLVRYEVMAAAYRILDHDHGLASVYEDRAEAVRTHLLRKTGKRYLVAVTEDDLPSLQMSLYWTELLKKEADVIHAIFAEQRAGAVSDRREATRLTVEAKRRRRHAQRRHDTYVAPLFRELYAFPPDRPAGRQWSPPRSATRSSKASSSRRRGSRRVSSRSAGGGSPPGDEPPGEPDAEPARRRGLLGETEIQAVAA